MILELWMCGGVHVDMWGYVGGPGDVWECVGVHVDVCG